MVMFFAEADPSIGSSMNFDCAILESPLVASVEKLYHQLYEQCQKINFDESFDIISLAQDSIVYALLNAR